MYQALYRKYRPQTFSDVVGQKSVTDTLRAQLETGKLSHAYLFTGTRGTGKTSCAKILAKAVNCENPNHGDPCGLCPSCRAIDEGSCMDVLEIDAASNNGVDSVRVLRDDAIYTPGTVKMRVYIIDEVHMLSTAAFNALLKIIEEPPAHLLFILATTELQKVPATILSRCQRFAFKRLRPDEIASRLNFIAYQEHIEIEPEAINLLARLADGGMRDGVSLLDQCASAANGPVTLESVYASLGLAGEKRTAELMQAIAEQDTAKALTIFSALYSAGKDVSALPRSARAAHGPEERAFHALRHCDRAAGAGAAIGLLSGRTDARTDGNAENPRLVRQEHRRARSGGAASDAAVRAVLAAGRAGAGRTHLARGGAAGLRRAGEKRAQSQRRGCI